MKCRSCHINFKKNHELECTVYGMTRNNARMIDPHCGNCNREMRGVCIERDINRDCWTAGV